MSEELENDSCSSEEAAKLWNTRQQSAEIARLNNLLEQRSMVGDGFRRSVRLVADLENEVDTRDREIERLREALKPFAELADQSDAYNHGDESTCEWRIKKIDLIVARKALNGEKE